MEIERSPYLLNNSDMTDNKQLQNGEANDKETAIDMAFSPRPFMPNWDV